MAGNPRERARNFGFWDGGDPARGVNNESGGKTSGLPGERKPSVVGVKTDLEYPDPTTPAEKSGTTAES
jgi:hypothetical protein